MNRDHFWRSISRDANVEVSALYAIFGEEGGTHIVSLAFGPHICASTVKASVASWLSGITMRFTHMLFPKVLNAKQGNSMYRIWFKSLVWLDRVSNPNLPHTKRAFYHWATDAVIFYLQSKNYKSQTCCFLCLELHLSKCFDNLFSNIELCREKNDKSYKAEKPVIALPSVFLLSEGKYW